MTWHVYADGSTYSESGVHTRGKGNPGGWAAVVEHGHDGYVIRGREAATTNVRMEFRAAINGLAEVPDGERVVLHTDCSTVITVQEKWADGISSFPNRRNGMRRHPDFDLWLELVAQLDRLHVAVEKIERGGDPIHRRAHVIAGAEAKAQRAGLPAHAEVLADRESLERQRRALARGRVSRSA